MKRKILLSLCMMSAFFIGTASAAGVFPFTDVPSSHWSRESVEYVYENGLMNGESNTAFRPDGSLTRSMFVTILGRMAGVGQDTYPGSSFSDVRTGQWYSSYVAWAARTGVTDGTGDGKFSPDDAVTREQMAAMIARYINSAGFSLAEAGNSAAFFTDKADISSWAQEGVELMRRTGILTGYEDGSFQPQETANRAEAATMFMRLDKALEQKSGSALTTKSLMEYFSTTDEIEKAGQPYLDSKGYVSISDIDELLDAVEAEVKHQQTLGTISDYEREEQTIWIQLASGIQYVYLAPLENTSSTGQEAHMSILTYEPFSRWWETERPGKNQDVNGEAATDGVEKEIAAAFDNYSFTENYDDAAVTLDSIESMSENQVILWDGHGDFTSKTHAFIALGEQLDEEAFLLNPIYYLQNMEHTADYLSGRIICTNMEDRIAIGSKYIEKYVSSLDGSLIYLGACATGKDSVFANAFLNKGATAVVANSETVLTDYTQAMQREIMSCMTKINAKTNQYYTLSEALSYAQDKFGKNDGYLGARVVIFGGSKAQNYRLGDNRTAALAGLAGTYEGSYYATQGETGLTLTIYEENGDYRALFDFYNLPGHTNAKEDSYTMDVSLADSGTFRFDADQWIEHPSGYSLLDLEGTLRGEVLSGDSPTPFTVTKTDQQETDMGWKQAYRDYIVQDIEKTAGNGNITSLIDEARYFLFDANGDNTPELWIDYMFTYAGNRLCTFSNGKVQELSSYVAGISYLPGEGLFLASGGHMGYFYDVVYRLEEGSFQTVVRGDYQIVDDNGVSVPENEYLYTWNGQAVAKEDYEENLRNAFETSRAVALHDSLEGQTYAGILKQLNT